MALFACACESGSDGTVDARITIPDAQVDSNPGEQDAGDGLCADLSDSLLSTPPLPTSCLPRCSSATREAVEACTTVECVVAALELDTTPAARFRLASGVYEVTCGGDATRYPCPVWQTYACFETFCPEEYYAWSACTSEGAGVDCNDEQSALDTCVDTGVLARACIGERTRECYAEAE